MKKLNSLFPIVLLSVLVACNNNSGSNSKITAERTLKVSGNCEQCEETIEKAGKLEGVETVDWDQETKLLRLRIDTLKTPVSDVMKAIAGSGYDNELYKSSDEDYANLPECCQYERVH